jgi:hypothetical protein
VTTVLRAVGGVQVEGSQLRLASIDADRLELVDVQWPPVRLAKSAAIPNGDGFRTDAGEVFYVDLLNDSPPIVDPVGQTDTDIRMEEVPGS